MSAIVKTITPFLEQKFLLKALDNLNIGYSLSGNTITTDRKDYYGNQLFILQNGKYSFRHDSSINREFYPYRKENLQGWQKVADFLDVVEIEYRNSYNIYMKELEEKRLEEEKIRIENERKAFVEKQRAEIIKKAEAKGYKVKEKMKGKQIQLVLVKHTY